MIKPIIAANWKMNKTISETVDFIQKLKIYVSNINDIEIIIAPSFISIYEASKSRNNSSIKIAAQNLYWEKDGAFTGEVSATMIKDAGCEYVILGHSERRQYFGETNKIINKKIKASLCAGIMPLLCVGETWEQRNKNETFEVIEKQISECLYDINSTEIQLINISYEPVWAIGTGHTATPSQADEAHEFIRKLISQQFGYKVAQNIRITYGGSVRPDNIDELMSKGHIDGVLVGSASLILEEFLKIINYKRT